MRPDRRCVAALLIAHAVLWTIDAARASERDLDSARWIWSGPGAVQDAPKETVFLRHTVRLDGRPTQAEIVASADNGLRLFVNGREILRSDNWEVPVKADQAPFLRPGENVLAVRAQNKGGAAGLLVVGHAVLEGDKRMDLSTGEAWRWTNKAPTGWDRVGFDDAQFKPVAVLGDVSASPWRIDGKLDQAVTPPMPRGPSFWTEWRRRQDAELAKQPRPHGPPESTGAENPVDALLYATWQEESTKPPARCADARFARRAYLDLVGLLPPVEVLAKFEGDDRPDKRDRLIDTLLADDLAYAEHWMSFWNDHLRNDEQTAIDGLRKPITTWLFDALLANMPYDVFVANLLNPDVYGPEGYVRGVQWRGAVSASQQPALQAAQNVAQVFLAAPIKCASCHDSFIDDWTLHDAYGLAGFFSEKDLTIHECDKATGEVVSPRFMFPEVGGVEATAGLAERRQRIAELVTSPRNPQFAKAIVNRMWRRLTGRALFEPLDTYDAEKVVHPELLEWLADDFIRHGYDVKHLLRRIAVSHAYQLPAVAKSEQKDDSQRLPGPPLRRLAAEQIVDAVATVTGYWPETSAMSAAVSNDRMRAWRHKVPDTLARALGRPAREQVNTKREADATVLQMLEMVNGTVLAERLAKGAETLLATPLGREKDARKVIEVLYGRAMSRPPTGEEVEILAPLIGSADSPAEQRRPGWEDALWAVFLDPEFQFIY